MRFARTDAVRESLERIVRLRADRDFLDALDFILAQRADEEQFGNAIEALGVLLPNDRAFALLVWFARQNPVSRLEKIDEAGFPSDVDALARRIGMRAALIRRAFQSWEFYSARHDWENVTSSVDFSPEDDEYTITLTVR